MATQHKTQWRQRGSTFLGIVVGLVVGLAVALAVAVYVTNIPVPFLHKAASRMPIQDEAEAARNQGWNPNAALQGGHTGEPVPGAATPSGTAPLNMPPPPAVVGSGPAPAAPNSSAPVTMPESGNAPAAPANATNNRPSGVAETPRTTATQTAPGAENDPLGALVARMASRTAATPGVSAMPANAPAAGGNFSYFVQAGAFGSAPDADAQRARLLLSGVTAQVSAGGASGQSVYRVRVGPFNSERAAQQVQSRLKQDGFEVALIRAAH